MWPARHGAGAAGYRSGAQLAAVFVVFIFHFAQQLQNLRALFAALLILRSEQFLPSCQMHRRLCRSPVGLDPLMEIAGPRAEMT